MSDASPRGVAICASGPDNHPSFIIVCHGVNKPKETPDPEFRQPQRATVCLCPTYLIGRDPSNCMLNTLLNNVQSTGAACPQAGNGREPQSFKGINHIVRRRFVARHPGGTSKTCSLHAFSQYCMEFIMNSAMN